MGTHPIFESDFDCLTEFGNGLMMAENLAVGVPFDGDSQTVTGNVENGSSIKIEIIQHEPRKGKQNPSEPNPNDTNPNPDDGDSSDSSDGSSDDNELDQSEIPSTSEIPSIALDNKVQGEVSNWE